MRHETSHYIGPVQRYSVANASRLTCDDDIMLEEQHLSMQNSGAPLDKCKHGCTGFPECPLVSDI